MERDRAPVPRELQQACEFQAAARRAEAAQLRAMLEHQDRAETALLLEELPLHARQEARKVPIRELALALRMSERTVSMVLNCARFARRELPRTWGAYTAGRIDQPRLRTIAEAAMGLEDPGHIQDLDAAAAEKAAETAPTQLRRWLNRFTARLSPEQFSRTCDRAQEQRYVQIFHQENGVSLLQALLPTVTAAAIEKRLRAAARGLDRPQPQDPELTATAGIRPGGPGPGGLGPGSAADLPSFGVDSDSTHPPEAYSPDARTPNPRTPDLRTPDPHAPNSRIPEPRTSDLRTLAQREADLLGAWLLDGRVAGAPVEATIAIMVPESTLTGESEEPALSADRGGCLYRFRQAARAWGVPRRALSGCW